MRVPVGLASSFSRIHRDRSSKQAQFQNSDVRLANLQGADLSQADFTRANLSYANLQGANLSGANLSGANLTGANFAEAIFQQTNLKDAILERVALPPTISDELSTTVATNTKIRLLNFEHYTLSKNIV